MKRLLYGTIFAAVVMIAIFVATFIKAEKTSTFKTEAIAPADEQPLLGLEIPQSELTENEQLIVHLGYTVGYNKTYKIPNWVAYELTDEEVAGEVPRDKNFVPDPEVDIKYSAVHKDYSNSGYDRGHMAPAADMKWSEQAMRESFYLSNICPQNQNLNRGDWQQIEDKGRDWAKEFGSIYIVTGPVMKEDYRTIGYNEVAVPEAFYKIFLQKRGEQFYAIAFLCKNESGSRPLKNYVVTIDSIEQLTKIDFFPLLDDEIETQIEAQIDIENWDLTTKKDKVKKRL